MFFANLRFEYSQQQKPRFKIEAGRFRIREYSRVASALFF